MPIQNDSGAELAALRRSHDELRAMLRIAIRALRELPGIRKRTALLDKMDTVLAEARNVRQATTVKAAAVGQ